MSIATDPIITTLTVEADPQRVEYLKLFFSSLDKTRTEEWRNRLKKKIELGKMVWMIPTWQMELCVLELIEWEGSDMIEPFIPPDNN